MATDRHFKETVDALFSGINGVVSSKTVVGGTPLFCHL